MHTMKFFYEVSDQFIARLVQMATMPSKSEIAAEDKQAKSAANESPKYLPRRL